MQVPILKQGSYLIASIQDALTDEDLAQLQQELVAPCRTISDPRRYHRCYCT